MIGSVYSLKRLPNLIVTQHLVTWLFPLLQGVVDHCHYVFLMKGQLWRRVFWRFSLASSNAKKNPSGTQGKTSVLGGGGGGGFQDGSNFRVTWRHNWHVTIIKISIGDSSPFILFYFIFFILWILWILWIVLGRCGSFWVRCGSLWIVVGRCGSLWVVLGRCGWFRVLVVTVQFMIQSSSIHDTKQFNSWYKAVQFMIQSSSIHDTEQFNSWYRAVQFMIQSSSIHDTKQFNSWYKAVQFMIQSS